VKIGLAQVNPVIGDFNHNCGRILAWARQAKERGCSLVIFPELVISGYPPQDLLERPSFLRAHEDALRSLMQELPDIDVMLGCLEMRGEGSGKKLFNSAVVIRKGCIVFRAHKQLLPSYDVFDETRYFEPGFFTDIYEVNGHRFGVTICEDVWCEEIKEYHSSPVDNIFQLAGQKELSIDGVINISASPFQRGKEETRKSIFRRIAVNKATAFLYCNQVGGQDSLLFDGRSMVIDGADGEVTALANGFQEDLIVVDTATWSGDMHGSLEVSEEASVYRALVMGTGDYLRKCSFDSAVLGLSGGVDSALTAAIAVDALGAENVLGVALPSPYSSPESLEDAERLARNLGCRFEVIPISGLFDAFRGSLNHLFKDLPEGLAEQNLQARIRGNILMALSNKFGHLLLTTGNKSEMAVGYCTLYGDMSGGLAVIADVPKQLVYELARYVNRDGEVIPERILTKAPSAELKPDQKDQDDLPPYETLDRILELYLEEGRGVGDIVGMGFDAAVVQDIVRRVRINEYKRKQAPIGLKVTSKAFGFGRRYPNVQNFRE
jgi:NAD+ synthase (glutamine-hydrolysing)